MLIAVLMRDHSSSPKLPVRRCALIDAAERGDHAEGELLARHFHAEDADLGLGGPNAAFSAMFSAKVVLPIEGRPATTIRSPFCRPAVISSSLLKPVLTAGQRTARLVQQVQSVDRPRRALLSAG